MTRNGKDHIVLIGLNFQNKRISGDKNYWFELLPLFAKKFSRITIFSVRRNIVKTEDFFIGDCLITIIYIFPSFLESPDKKRKIFWKQGAFPSWLGVIEKLLTTKRLIMELKDLCHSNPYQHVHLMDNFGLANRILVAFSKSPVSVSAIAYQGKSPEWLYNQYLRISYNVCQLTVVAYNTVLEKKLFDIGIHLPCITVVPWGVPLSDKFLMTETIRREGKAALGFDPEVPLILWSGYIQQVKKNDFKFAYDVARKVSAKGYKANFFFAFKPESFESEFLELDKIANIMVKVTSVKEFAELKSACDMFFSPVVNLKCIVAPPLTWIELLGYGKPLVSTKVPGADRVIVNGVTGYMCESISEFLEAFQQVTANQETQSANCTSLVKEHFNICNSADLYGELFSH